MRRVATGAMDTARRLERSLPRPLRTWLRDVAAWSDRHHPPLPIEGWSRPLIETQPGSEATRNGLIGAATTTAGHGVVEPSRSHRLVEAGDADGPVLRCLFVTGLFDIGGMEEMVAFLARRLPAKGLQTAALHATSDPSASGNPRGRIGRMLLSSGVEVREADERRALDWIKQWQPDVISAHGAPDWVLDIAHRFGVPYVDNLHGMLTLFRADWQAKAARNAKVSAVVAVSELVRQQYLAGYRDFPPARIVTIPNAVDDERRLGGDRAAARDRLGLTDEYVLVSLARHCLQKNSYGLITAFGDVARRRPEAHLVIAGHPHSERYYRQTLRLRDSMPWRDRIHLRDHVAAPAELLAAADGFVLDSFFEGWSVASTEALFAGLPVVLSDVGGARELIGNDPARGRLVANPIGDPLNVDWESLAAAGYRPQANRDEFAAAMDHLVANRAEYLCDRERLAAESAARFSAEICLGQHAAVLRAVAAGTDLPCTNDSSAASPPAKLHSCTYRRNR
jgi:glycosyltransferase involved in cell wall biosynthesis